MSGHTPWVVAETITDDEGLEEIVIRCGPAAVAVAVGGLPVHIQEANARLIAAAPDLLEAGTELQSARKAQKLTPSAENLSRVRLASDAFDAAIAKARATSEDRSEKGGVL